MPFIHVPTGLNLSLLTELDFSRSTSLVQLWTKSNNSLEVCFNIELKKLIFFELIALNFQTTIIDSIYVEHSILNMEWS